VTPQPDRGGSDPPAAVVDCATQRVSDLPATLAQLGADTNHRVVGLDYDQFPPARWTSPGGCLLFMWLVQGG